MPAAGTFALQVQYSSLLAGLRSSPSSRGALQCFPCVARTALPPRRRLKRAPPLVCPAHITTVGANHGRLSRMWELQRARSRRLTLLTARAGVPAHTDQLLSSFAPLRCVFFDTIYYDNGHFTTPRRPRPPPRAVHHLKKKVKNFFWLEMAYMLAEMYRRHARYAALSSFAFFPLPHAPEKARTRVERRPRPRTPFSSATTSTTFRYIRAWHVNMFLCTRDPMPRAQQAAPGTPVTRGTHHLLGRAP